METRRTNQFLRVAFGSRSPARPKYFKSKFYDNQKETKLNLPISFNTGNKTAYGGERPKFKEQFSFESGRAKTTD